MTSTKMRKRKVSQKLLKKQEEKFISYQKSFDMPASDVSHGYNPNNSFIYSLIALIPDSSTSPSFSVILIPKQQRKTFLEQGSDI